MAKEQIEKKEVKLHVRIFIFCLTTILISFLFISNLYSQTGWFRQYSNNQLDFYSVYFINQNTGWVVGGREADEWGCIYKTTNGGTNWVVQWMGPNNFRYSVCFADQNTGWVVGCTSTFKGTIYNTINGGTNWSVNGVTQLAVYSV